MFPGNVSDLHSRPLLPAVSQCCRSSKAINSNKRFALGADHNVFADSHPPPSDQLPIERKITPTCVCRYRKSPNPEPPSRCSVRFSPERLPASCLECIVIAAEQVAIGLLTVSAKVFSDRPLRIVTELVIRLRFGFTVRRHPTTRFNSSIV